ncbi:response regulator [Massilia arenosa]|uniref:histidine kinase n=1 Tax=Zemynaea arenosa TaxID=2561931 RepID=A0A4Y9SDS9_9BURK|nr:response regulator [Massilia arenosa]TFW20847.1 response regulator [Massilia arenosa]
MSIADPFTSSVLLIDDETLADEFLRHCVRDCDDIQMRYLAQAREAPQIAQESEATVVIVDLRMPSVDGFDVIRMLRQNPATEHLPVILLSSEEDPEIKAKAFSLGANDYLVKWPDARELTARIRYHSGAYRARMQRDEAFNALRRSQVELAQSQAALHQAQKMEAIGQLTGGVAHDFNNVLQIIGGNLQLVKLIGGVNDAARARIDTALAGVERGARLAAHLLAFARRQPLQSVVINPGNVIVEMEEMMRRVLGMRVTIVTEIEEKLWSTAVDPGQLHNVILNLSINARDAMPLGGTLTISAQNVPAGSRVLAEVAEGDHVLIEVRDTGVGMPPDVLERAFEPFFTTKPTGQGTGLGLSMAYGFVKQSGGEIQLKSTPGQGTSVRIFLARSAETPNKPEEPTAASLQGGPETILVVEDEADVRSTTVALLSALGYRVLEAADAGSACDIVNSGVELDLVFSDVIMPGKVTAYELGELVKQKLPATQMLYTSGYAEGVIAHEGKLDPSISLLQKPYHADVLSARIRHLLRRRKQAVS